MTFRKTVRLSSTEIQRCLDVSNVFHQFSDGKSKPILSHYACGWADVGLWPTAFVNRWRHWEDELELGLEIEDGDENRRRKTVF
jgi:hypothetical protein